MFGLNYLLIVCMLVVLICGETNLIQIRSVLLGLMTTDCVFCVISQRLIE